jgi:hypothetical protein
MPMLLYNTEISVTENEGWKIANLARNWYNCDKNTFPSVVKTVTKLQEQEDYGIEI